MTYDLVRATSHAGSHYERLQAAARQLASEIGVEFRHATVRFSPRRHAWHVRVAGDGKLAAKWIWK